MSVAPPTCRMPVRIDEVSKFLRRCQNRGLHCPRDQLGGLLALASVYLACRDLVPAFLQRSPPLLLAIAACSGLRPAPDCRPQRALLHLSYSCAPPILTTVRDTRHLFAVCRPRHGRNTLAAEQEAVAILTLISHVLAKRRSSVIVKQIGAPRYGFVGSAIARATSC